jgi:phosphoribosylglycinamide formyltransferase-1
VVAALRKAKVSLVVFAGFMRIVTPVLVGAFRGRIVNIHPSLLPAFPGTHAQRDAVEWGVKVSGCTVHFVDNEYDHGPIILQHVVPVLEDDTPQVLAARVFDEECRALPEAIRLIAARRVSVEGRRVRIRPVL